MNEVLQSIIIGGIQGISEFLPISSSGHLVIFPYLFNWDYKGLSFDIALHFGTVLALIAFFWRDWVNIISTGLGVGSKEKNAPRPTPHAPQVFPKNFLWMILFASIPAAVVGYLIEDYVESNLHSPLLIAFNLAFFGIILWMIDRSTIARYKIQDTRYKQSFLIGLAQAISLMPGVSRSGITMTAGRGVGFSRKDAAKFSFLLGTPAMLGAFVFALKNFSSDMVGLPFITGILSSMFFGFLAIKYLLRYLEKSNFSVFVWYRLILALIILIAYFF